jgi:hypothetical protein
LERYDVSLFRKNTAHEGGRTREQNRTIVQRERERGNLTKEG